MMIFQFVILSYQRSRGYPIIRKLFHYRFTKQNFYNSCSDLGRPWLGPLNSGASGAVGAAVRLESQLTNNFQRGRYTNNQCVCLMVRWSTSFILVVHIACIGRSRDGITLITPYLGPHSQKSSISLSSCGLFRVSHIPFQQLSYWLYDVLQFWVW